MILERFYDEKLAQVSYLIGCAATGEAVVVDPHRDTQQYIDAAEAEGLEITHLTETHIHADFVSGLRELAARTGATVYLSDEGDENWKYAFVDEFPTVLLRDGDHFDIGNIRFDVIATPGHTPEHITFLVTDRAAADRPIGALTGDFVFVGDIGRPDLLEKAAGVEGTMEPGARRLFHSLQRFKEQPDWLQIWPGHGAGSACGKGLSSIPHSTVGYERLFNWAFQIEDENEFIEAVLSGQPEPPKYFAEMKRVNKEGPAILEGFQRPEALSGTRFLELIDEGALFVDTRLESQYGAEQIPGTINIPLNRSFNTWAGWLIEYGRDFYLIVDDQDPALTDSKIDQAVRDLAFVGLDQVAGTIGISEAIEAWTKTGRQTTALDELSPAELAAVLEERDEELAVIDVRGQNELDNGSLTNGTTNGRDLFLHIPLGYLTDRIEELPADRLIVLYCQGGGRSAVGASLLRARGIERVANLAGGYDAWKKEGYPTLN